MKNKKEGHYGHFIFSLYLNNWTKPFCQTFLKNSSSFIREAAQLKEPELELFLEEPKLCQTDP